MSIVLTVIAAVCLWQAQVSYEFYSGAESGHVNLVGQVLQFFSRPAFSQPAFEAERFVPITERNIRYIFEYLALFLACTSIRASLQARREREPSISYAGSLVFSIFIVALAGRLLWWSLW